MRYIFEMDLHPDGDFGFPFLIPCGLIWNNEKEKYSFKKEYSNRKTAVKEVNKICTYLKDNVHGRDYVVDGVRLMFEEFLNELNSNTSNENLSIENEYVHEEMSGNYDGTEITFYSEPEYYYDLPWTDEELDIIINSKNSPTQKDLKQAILNLYKEKE